ncbi:hypothetical protein D0860_01129 [Hortaea werneckii]|uniref:Uncharacterized protein n=1 Tax=Hortaea werneckii TaxID=91943 RepID=A0A3M7I1A1_HORWE|nr:hypothetical protein D0860_01129 [Hortaea werneckii]RMZ19304.1 hypothetical protein D0859_16705 [Hortaea werneckii]
MVAPTASEPRTNNNGHRLYVKGKHVAFKRGKHTLRPGTSLIKIEGVDDPQAAHFYLGKRIAYVYRGKKEIRGTKIRVIWGKVARPHGKIYPQHPFLGGKKDDSRGVMRIEKRARKRWAI